MPKKKKRLAPLRWWVVSSVAVAGSAALGVAWAAARVPLPQVTGGAQSTRVLAADGSLIATLHGEENRTVVSLTSISPHLIAAVVAAEDRTFYKHNGVSPRGILRALVTNAREGEFRQGGSTITQQYVRNAFVEVGRERSIARKLREALMALRLERDFGKDRILELYLNTVYFGRGAYGAEAAARSYFSKPAKDLTVAEAAYLAGVIRAPERFQPDRSPERAESIRRKVLDDMVDAERLTEEEAKAARDEALNFKLSASVEAETTRAAYFVEFVRQQLLEEFELSDQAIQSGGLVVHTTLDLDMQAAAERAITTTLDRADDPEAALVAMSPDGSVRAMVGGRDVTNLARARGFNYAYHRSGKGGGRQAGSAFKPFTLAAFLEEGYSIRSIFNAPASTEVPSDQCKNKDGSPWSVSNFGDEEYGTIDVVDATVRSANTVYAQMIDLVKPRKVVKIAQAAGITGELPYVCSLALGTAGVTPLEMARAYATFAQRGVRPDVLSVTKIVAPDGRVIAERGPRSERAFDANVADQVTFALNENMKRGTGKAARLGRATAGKTGTTQNHIDAWFVGYTPALSTAVWMGFPPDETGKVREMTGVRGRNVTGGSFPATIWRRFMSEALSNIKAADFTAPNFRGEILSPSPTPCPNASPPLPPGCIPPSPSPSPSALPGISPVPTPSLLPSPSPE